MFRSGVKHVPNRRDADYRGPTPQHLRILAIIRRIPRGRVMTYGEVAKRAGLLRGARLVGYVLRTCPLAADVPWHRVIAAGGRIALRDDADMRRQRERLMKEGLVVTPSGRVKRLVVGQGRGVDQGMP